MIKQLGLILLLWIMVLALQGQQGINEKTTIEGSNKLPGTYFIRRGGLNNSLQIFGKNKQANVAFLGGSITYNPGWRQMVCNYLKDRFPTTRFHFIAAGIPSLGSLPHAFRLQRDVLDSGKIDLLFVETAVNDRANGTDSITQVRALEGIVRHARKSNSFMDIIVMSFADPGKINDYNHGIVPVEIANHELVSAHYNLPSLNLAKEVRDRITNGEFSWADDFKDLHPSPFGQQLYFDAIKKLLVACFDGVNKKTNVTARQLPLPLNKANFENGRYLDIMKAGIDSNWMLDEDWTPKDSLPTRQGFVHVPVLLTTTPGAALRLPFKGTAIGIAIVSGADAGMIEYSIDGAPYKTVDLYTEWSSMLHLPWYILLGSNLKSGSHSLHVRVSQEKNNASKGYACRLIYFLVND
ncbi:MAG: Alpha/beta hydrolase family protein [Ferruginibacter sp.]|nr:Alpha/beta hydrolase family protein [Ferruginibacter sp.]